MLMATRRTKGESSIPISSIPISQLPACLQRTTLGEMRTLLQPESQLAALRALLGAAAVLPGDAAGDGYLVDQRGLYRGHPLAVVLPATTAEVAAVVGWCSEHGVGIVPQGGNTGYCGGATPDGSGTQLVIGLRRLQRVRAVDARDYSLVAEAGCTLAEVQAAAAAVQRYFPLSLGSEGSCQIGGNLATNAGGLNVLRYGMARAQVLGLEAVLPDGRIWNGLNTLRKDNTGYHLASLLVGSEGTLGIITAAALRLQPAPAGMATALVALDSVDAALPLLACLRSDTGDRLSSLEYLPAAALQLVQEQLPGLRSPFSTAYPACLLIELDTGLDATATLQQALARAQASGMIADAVFAGSSTQRAALWQLRESIPEAQRRLGASIKHDVSLPLTALAEFMQRVADWVQRNVPEGLLICYGHLGDGNLHCNVGQRPGVDRTRFLARQAEINLAVHDLVQQLGGSISAEHGIGQLKVEALAHYVSAEKLQLMRLIKQALDPDGIMNPGKVLKA
jgi:FAD/FMN-containing dehydrogenase